MIPVDGTQGGRSFARARRAFAKKFDLVWKFWALTHTISILRFVAIYTLFGNLLAKKVFFWVKNSVSWARNALLHGMYCIFYWVKLANLQLRAKMTHLLRKKFLWPFLPPPKGYQLLPPWWYWVSMGQYLVVMGRHWSVLRDTGSVLSDTGWFLVSMGRYWLVLGGTGSV